MVNKTMPAKHVRFIMFASECGYCIKKRATKVLSLNVFNLIHSLGYISNTNENTQAKLEHGDMVQ